MMKNIRRSIWLILIFLALGWLTHCGGSIIDKKEVVDTVNPIVTITEPADGATVNSATVVVTGTVSDPVPSSGLPETITVVIPGSAEVTQSAQVTQNVTIGAGGNWTTTFTGVPEGPGQTVTASLRDLSGNLGSATNTFGVSLVITGFAMKIESPTDGAVVVTVNGITPGSVIASIPFQLTWVNGTSPYNTSGLTVVANGLTTTQDAPTTGMLSITSPSTASTTASGRIQVTCDVSAGSFGATNVTITAYGVSDAQGLAIPDSVNVTVQLGEIGVEDVTVVETGTTFIVPVNAFYDPGLGDSLGSFDIIVTFDPDVVKIGPNTLFDNCTAGNPVSGSSGVFAAPEFSNTPTVPLCSNTMGIIFLSSVRNASTTDPVGFFNVANINFTRIGAAGSSTHLMVSLIDFANSNGDGSYRFGEIPPGYPLPEFPTYIKSGRVDIILP